MKYVSGRVKELKVGISSYSEDKTPFSVVGNVDVIGIISATTVSISTTTDVASEFTNINVSGISTFNGEIDSNGRIVGAATSNVIPFLYSNYSDLPSAGTYHGAFAHVHATQRAYFAHGGAWYQLINQEPNGTVGTGTERYNIGPVDLTSLDVSGIATFTNVIDSNGRIVGAATSNVIPFLFSNFSDLPSAVTYHGAFAHVHGTGKAYYAHAANWYELVNKELNGTVGTGTEKYDIGITSVTSLYVSGISTYDGNLDVQSSVVITGITTIGGLVDINAGGQANTFKVEDLTDNRVVIAGTGGELEDDANLTFNGSTFNVGSAITMYQATGIISATAFYGDGSGLDNTGATLSASSGSQRLVLTSLTSGTMTSAATDADLSFDATTNLLSAGKLIVSGISTFGGTVNIPDGEAINFANGLGNIKRTATDGFKMESSGSNNLHIEVNSGGGTAGDIVLKSDGTTILKVPGDKSGVIVTGLTSTSSLNVSGISTLGVTSATNLETQQLNVTGVSTFNTNSGPTTIEPGLVTINPNGANHAQLTIISQESNDSVGPIIKLDRSAGFFSSDEPLGEIRFTGRNSGSGSVDYVKITGRTTDRTAGTEHGKLQIISVKAGTASTNAEFRSDGLYLLNDSFLNVTGVSTFSKPVGITSDLRVTGTTRLDGIVSSNNNLITVDTDVWVKSTNGIRLSTTTASDAGRLRLKGDGVSGRVESAALQLNTHFDGASTQHALTADRNSSVKIYHSGNQKLETTTHGVVVTGIATADGAVVGDLTSGRVVLAGTSGRIEDSSKVTFNGSTFAVVGDANFTGDVTVQGTLTSEDKTNIDSIGIVTARTGVRINAGGLVVTSGVSTFTDAINSNGDANISGTLNANGDVNLGNATSDTISAVGRFDTDVVPSSDGAKDLGLDAVRWRNLYADVLHGDGSQLTGITAAGTGAIGGLTVKDEGVTVGTAGSVSTFDFRGATITAIANTGAAGIATVTVITEQNQNIQTLNVSGLSTFTGDATFSNAITVSGNINANQNIIGDGATNIHSINNVSASTLNGTLNTSAQPNITSLGTLTSLTSSGTIQAADFNSTSDARLKTNVQTITSPLDKINQIGGVTFEWIADNKSSVGVIADTVEKVFPELIGQTLEVSDKDETRYKTVNYNGLIGLLIEAVKEQQVQITELKTKLDSLS